MSPSSTRWSPTPEQLMILEEMYKGGVRTPNATQIQKITAHLSFYGKIEGKNVFYWFQNHKARDRQKLRKKLTKQLQLQHQQLLQDQLFLHHQYDQNFSHHICNNASISNNVVLGLIDPPPPSAGLHALQYDRPAEYLRLKGGTDDDGGTARVTKDGGVGSNNTWKMDHHNISSSENCMIKSSSSSSSLGDDWMMMTTTTTTTKKKKTMMMSMSMTRDNNTAVGPTCTLPCCTTTNTTTNNNKRPLKTLELFPIISPSSVVIKEHQIYEGATTSDPNNNISLPLRHE